MVYDLWGKKRLGLILRETELFSVFVIRIKAARSVDRALATHVRRAVALSERALVDVCMCTHFLDDV